MISNGKTNTLSPYSLERTLAPLLRVPDVFPPVSAYFCLICQSFGSHACRRILSTNLLRMPVSFPLEPLSFDGRLNLAFVALPCSDPQASRWSVWCRHPSSTGKGWEMGRRGKRAKEAFFPGLDGGAACVSWTVQIWRRSGLCLFTTKQLAVQIA